MELYHLPMLGIADGASAPALGGVVRRFLLEEFAELDPDWAHGNYFVRSSAVWVSDSSGHAGDDELYQLPELLRLAAIALLKAPLPSPLLSIRYSSYGNAWSRSIGPFERTLLLQDHIVVTADGEALREIGELADQWYAAGYKHDHPVFGALDAFGAIYTSFNARPELAMMPTMVALEGIFAPARMPGIAKRMESSLSNLLSNPVVPEVVKRLYDIRSDIIHGRPLDDAAAESATGEAGTIACYATAALMERLINNNIPQDRWTEALEQGA